MNRKKDFPSREQLEQAFYNLHDQINRISVEEEEEMVIKDTEEKKNRPD